MLSEVCKNRLLNWKFNSAKRHLTFEATENETSTVLALAAAFGNVGHFEGVLSNIVRAAVQICLDGTYDDGENEE